eukprot:COSAG02_NODE_10922_length_1831_cov_1.566975_3_plen_61_part_00
MRSAKRRHSGSSCVSNLSLEIGAKHQVAKFSSISMHQKKSARRMVTDHPRLLKRHHKAFN